MKLEIDSWGADGKVCLSIGNAHGRGVRSKDGRAVLGTLDGELIFVWEGKVIWREPAKNVAGIILSPDWLWVAEDLANRQVLVGDITGLMFRLPSVPFRLEGIEEDGPHIVIRWDGRRLKVDRAGQVLEDKDRRNPSEEDLLAADAHIYQRWVALDLAEALFAEAQKKPQAHEKALRLFTRLETQFRDYPQRRGRCLRRLGELALMSSDLQAALRHWRAAVKMDPKCGIASRLGKLEKTGD